MCSITTNGYPQSLQWRDTQFACCEHNQRLINEDCRLAELDLETKNWYGGVIFKHGG